MIYPINFEQKIGFDRIRELVAEQCLFEPGRDRIRDLQFQTAAEAITRELDLVDEFRLLELSDQEFPLHTFVDNRASLQKAKVEGAFLEVEEVFGLSKSLEAVRLILRFFKQQEEEDYPALRKLASLVKLYPFVSERIGKILNKHGQIKDGASPELGRLRSSIAGKQSSVTRQLHKIMRRAQQEGWMEEDSGVTLRNGRPVLPMNASSKRALGGLVHDESTTGKTVYVEPSEVVELNNEIRELEYAERREIVTILVNFTDAISPYIEELEQLHEFLAEIDSIRARALFAIRIDAIRPAITPDPGFDWKQAVHPLLHITLKELNRKVVPLSLELTGEDHILLISGPNAGGKSVCLKTVGLLQYMMQCGLLVPVLEGSRFGIFQEIFIDIGDEQSIDNDLSTYSSHLVNMKHFVKHAGPESLVLIDEFGTGTEPMLGGAIAESILAALNDSGTHGVITTHYTNLKHFAASHEGIVNGAMLFDNHQMQPLYELQVGKPGSSFAFEIAKKIGLPDEVLQAASDLVGQDHIDFDKHLKDILRDKKYWERKRQKIRQSEKRLEELMLKYESELGDSEKRRKALIGEARQQAEEMLASANKEIERTIREIKESNAEREQTREARKRLESFRDKVSRSEEESVTDGAREYLELKRREQELSRQRPDIRKRTKKQNVEKEEITDRPEIRAGDFVRLKGQTGEGEVMEIKGKNVTVRFGSLKSIVKVDRLEKLMDKEMEGKKQKPKARVDLGDWSVSKRRVMFRSEIDVRGQRAEAALRKVTEMIDEAVMVGAPEIRILHGKGDGILRHLIRELLQGSDVVEWFGDEHVERGGAGITLVRFNY